MKILLLSIVACAGLSAGPLKVATYPLVHPKKDAHAVKAVTKGLYKAGKAVLW